MIILTAALAKAGGDASLAQRYWGPLTKWARYLKDKGLDPENAALDRRLRGTIWRTTRICIALGGDCGFGEGLMR